ncbi:MAG: VOC family protein [Steroidobacteraceae bacterium]
MSRTGPVKRITIWVRDIDRSLALYRDLLGLEVVEDKSLAGPAIMGMAGYRDGRIRMVHLAPAGADYGWIGLYALQDAKPAPDSLSPPRTDRLSYGQAAIVLTTSQIDAIAHDLEAQGYEFVLRPQGYAKTTDSPNMPAGRYTEMIFLDPDGIPVSIMGFEPLR